MNNKKWEIAIVAVLLILLGGSVVLFFQKKDLKKTDKSENSIPAAQEEYVYVDPNVHAQSQILEINQLTGTIVEIFDPAGAVNGERRIAVQADVIDSEKVKNVDFTKESNDLPMIRKEIQLKVDDQTKFVKGSLKGLQPGDFVYIQASDSIYSGNKLSAQEVTVLNLAK